MGVSKGSEKASFRHPIFKQPLQSSSVRQTHSFAFSHLRQGYLREGKCHLALGDYKSALRSLHRVRALEPSNTAVDADVKSCSEVKQLQETAEQAYSAKDFRKVTYLMDRALAHAPASVHSLNLKAECLVHLGRYQEAQEIANDVVAKDQTNADGLFVRGMCLYYQDQAEKAFQHFQRVLQFSPDHYKAREFYKKVWALYIFLSN